MIRRWLAYTWETFEPLPKLILSVFVVLAADALIRARVGEAGEGSNLARAVGILTVYLLFLYVRVADEPKDYEVDRKYFPERPVPSGRISLRDLAVLKWLTIASIVALNLVWRGAVWECAATLAFLFLTEWWLFMPRLLKGNRILAFLTHAPAYGLMTYYVAALAASQYGARPAADLALLAIWFVLPLFNYEFARKTRRPEDEQAGYQTYSAMIGYRASTSVALAFVALHALGLFVFAARFRVGDLVQWGIGIAAAATLLAGITFIARPRSLAWVALSKTYALVPFALLAAKDLVPW